MHDAGASVREIASAMHVGTGTIHRLLEQTLRPLRGAEYEKGSIEMSGMESGYVRLRRALVPPDSAATLPNTVNMG